MSEHSCAFCRIARQVNIDQIERFTKSGKSAPDFLDDPAEEQISSDVTQLMIEHDKIKIAEHTPHKR